MVWVCEHSNLSAERFPLYVAESLQAVWMNIANQWVLQLRRNILLGKWGKRVISLERCDRLALIWGQMSAREQYRKTNSVAGSITVSSWKAHVVVCKTVKYFTLSKQKQPWWQALSPQPQHPLSTGQFHWLSASITGSAFLLPLLFKISPLLAHSRCSRRVIYFQFHKLTAL